MNERDALVRDLLTFSHLCPRGGAQNNNHKGLFIQICNLKPRGAAEGRRPGWSDVPPTRLPLTPVL